MLPFRFGVHAAVAPTMSAWRDQARMAEGLGYSTLYVSTTLTPSSGLSLPRPWPPRRPPPSASGPSC